MNDCFPIFYGLEASRERLRQVATGVDFSRLGKEDASVREIIQSVRENGDAALRRYTREFDRVDIPSDRLRVKPQDFSAARAKVDADFVEAVSLAKDRIEAFHRKRVPHTWVEEGADGVTLGQKVTPLHRVGAYAPGGRASYPSTVLMMTIPAKVAGVEEVALVCPPAQDGEISPYTLVAAEVAGIEEVYRVGGAQAIAALALGTETIPRVDKIVGPGNNYVVLAKKLLYGGVGIDALPGPSEVAILADETARPEYVAADLMAQSEHGPDSCSLLITTCADLARSVVVALEEALSVSERAPLIRESFRRFGGAMVVDTLDEAVELLNAAAAEHVQLMIADAWECLKRVRHAGAIFIGECASVPLGDYVAGPSHVLPTATTARFASGLGVEDFVTRSSIIGVSRSGVEALVESIEVLARAEGLPAHGQAVRVRLRG